MFTKRSAKKQSRFISIALILSLVVSFSPGLTMTSLAAEGDDPPIVGEAVTPFQIQLAASINQRLAAGQPSPSVVFSSDPGSTENFRALSEPLTMEAVDQTTTTTALTTLYFDGPQEAGYDAWPPVEVTGNLAGGDPFATGDLTDLMYDYVEAQEPGFWNNAVFGQESREFMITETIELSPASDPPLPEMRSLGPLGAATTDSLFLADSEESTQEDILMGFTYTGPHIRYIIEQQAQSCYWLFGKICIEWYYIKAGFELDLAAGLRLPATVILSKGESEDPSPVFMTSFDPNYWQDQEGWTKDQYNNAGVAPEDGNEFILRLYFFAGIKVRVAGTEICPPGYICNLEFGNKFSASFDTPFGGGSFPIEELEISIYSISGAGVTVSANLTIDPDLSSNKITADWKASQGDCTETGVVIYASTESIPINLPVNCYVEGTPIEMTITNFRYYFDNFTLGFGAGVSVDLWGIWSGSFSKTVFELDLSQITGDLSLGYHVQCNFIFVCKPTGPDNVLVLTASDDKTPPIITPSIGDGWYNSEQKLTWEVVEEESRDTLITSGCDEIIINADQAETLYTCTATSAGGQTQVNVIIGIDKSPPDITCPIAGPFLLNSGDIAIGPADVEDLLSGFDSKAEGNLLTGTISTATAGPKTLDFTAYDWLGNMGMKTCSYDVVYNSGGFLPPVYEFNEGKAGRTYPIKWQLTDFGDNFISDLLAVSNIVANPSSACSASETATPLVAEASVQSTWRYDSSDNQFIYNWSTPGTPGCYALDVTLLSGQIMTAYFNLK